MSVLLQTHKLDEEATALEQSNATRHLKLQNVRKVSQLVMLQQQLRGHENMRTKLEEHLEEVASN